MSVTSNLRAHLRAVIAALPEDVPIPEGKPARPDGLLLDVRAAAALLGISEDALRSRVKRRRIPGVVRSGGRVEFHREVLLAALEKRAKR